MSGLLARNLFTLNEQVPKLIKNMQSAAVRNNCSGSATGGQRLKGKVAIVTASTDGIGYAIAKRLAADGANVVISSRKVENVTKALASLKSEGLNNVHGVKCHVALAADRKNLFTETIAKYGGLDIFVSNAAVNPTVGPVTDCPEEAWDKIFDVNVKSAFLLAKDAAPLIRKRGGGSILFISSMAGFNPFALLGAYSVSKTALLGLTKAIAQDLASDKIRVNCIAPGVIKTKFASALYETKAAHDAVVSSVPLGRLGEPHEIAGVASFLVSEDASYITGETIASSGGMVSRL